MRTRTTRYTFSRADRASCARKPMSMKDFDRRRMPGDDIVYNHIGSNSFRHAPFPSHSRLVVYIALILISLVKYDKKNSIPTSPIRYYCSFCTDVTKQVH